MYLCFSISACNTALGSYSWVSEFKAPGKWGKILKEKLKNTRRGAIFPITLEEFYLLLCLKNVSSTKLDFLNCFQIKHKLVGH